MSRPQSRNIICLYLDMHGLVFETSIWLLAGSTRLLSSSRRPPLLQQSAAGSKVCQNWWSPRASQTHWFVRLRTCFRDLQSIGAYTQSTDRWSKCSLRVGAFGANLLQLEAFALRRSRICEAGLANTIHTQSYNNLCSLWEGLRCSSSA